MKWNQIHKTELIEENIVSGIHIIELFEKLSGYHTSDRNYFSRIKETLEYIPEKYHNAAIALFSSVIYVPNQLLDQSFSFFWELFLYNNNIEESLSICQFFEIDPSGLINKFCHQNNIQQRLHPDHFIRIQNVDEMKEAFFLLLHNDHTIQEDVKKRFAKFSKKKQWIILTDKALSGQSLFKDLERYLFLRKLVLDAYGIFPRITIFAQIITEDAIHYGNEKIKNESAVEIKYGICFDRSMKVNSETCKLFNNIKIKNEVRDLCNWLADEILDSDDNYDRMKEKSRDNLAFGYKGCGLTLVDHSNCPTNSIPLLWYNNTDYYAKKNIKPYKGPYPRVHSRLGKQENEPSDESWEIITNKYKELLDILKND